MAIDINTSQRVFVCGKTRSGKSVFAKSLLYMYPRILVHDRKHEHTIDLTMHQHFSVVHDTHTLVMAIQKGVKKILYQPADPAVEDFDEVCKIVFQTGNMAIMVDEAASYVSSSQIPFWFGEILRLGGLRGVGCIMLSQRPRAIHNTLISECEYIFCFRLQLKTDRDKLREVIGEEVEILRDIPYYHYLAYDGDNIMWCSPVPVKGV